MPIIHDFTTSISQLTWVAGKRAYHAHARNSLIGKNGTSADALTRGLYLYLYSNHGQRHPIRNKNGQGVIICPEDQHCLKSGKFQYGLHEHIRKNVHGHLWRPDATPPEDHIAPTAMCWFLAFETDPIAKAPDTATQGTREKYYNSRIRDWLHGLNLHTPGQPGMLEHRWIPSNNGAPPITAAQGKQFLSTLLASHPSW
ncbi:hypothetical protein [Sorangium sp. So ce385]|uniref:hypothetical protein n=1 Tax=Sorangium sp. So ce385 TaxID=3133308 RepID=UPI003F5BF0DA